MALLLKHISEIVNQLAPKYLAQTQDNIGLQIGSPGAPIERVLVALDPAPAVIDEAIRVQAQLIITHHPLFYRPVFNVNYETPPGKLLKQIIGHNLNLFSAHTNWDAASSGANQHMAELLGLSDIQPLSYQSLTGEKKLVVFVPQSHAQAVFEAIMQAGAGVIGNYSHCSFWLSGSGTFRASVGASPSIGQVGQLERVQEVRIEVLLKENILPGVIQAMIKAHPYEEAAYDIYPLEQCSPGFGRVGNIRECSLNELCGQLRQNLNLSGLRYAGDPNRRLTRIAVCTGSGGSMYEAAAASGAQVLVTGDVSYHQAQAALNLGLCVVDVGHFAPEKLSMSHMADLLRGKLAGFTETVEVIEAESEDDLFLFHTL